ncbi:MAG: HDOD domain-containing protein, partial [Anaerolineales bacterium]|nr:HDOD domain-containing protein [Anaerolineales bacterium]
MTLSPNDLDGLIRKTEKASPMGLVLQKALAIMNDPNSDANQLARVIQLDQTLAGFVLRAANSAHISPANRISSVRRAVAQLGQQEVKRLLLSAAAASFLDTPLPGYGLARGALWQHAIGMATGARFLTAGISVMASEAAYTAGLLADIGLLTLDKLLPPAPASPPTVAEERARLGLDHAALGAEVARRWRLPEIVAEAIRCHHTPAQAKTAGQVAAALHLVDVCLVRNGLGLRPRPETMTPEPASLELFDLAGD